MRSKGQGRETPSPWLPVSMPFSLKLILLSNSEVVIGACPMLCVSWLILAEDLPASQEPLLKRKQMYLYNIVVLTKILRYAFRSARKLPVAYNRQVELPVCGRDCRLVAVVYIAPVVDHGIPPGDHRTIHQPSAHPKSIDLRLPKIDGAVSPEDAFLAEVYGGQSTYSQIMLIGGNPSRLHMLGRVGEAEERAFVEPQIADIPIARED